MIVSSSVVSRQVYLLTRPFFFQPFFFFRNIFHLPPLFSFSFNHTTFAFLDPLGSFFFPFSFFFSLLSLSSSLSLHFRLPQQLYVHQSPILLASLYSLVTFLPFLFSNFLHTHTAHTHSVFIALLICIGPINNHKRQIYLALVRSIAHLLHQQNSTSSHQAFQQLFKRKLQSFTTF